MDFIKHLFTEFERILYFGVETEPETEPESEPEPEPEPEPESEPKSEPESEPEIINLQENTSDDIIGLQQRNTYTICDNV
tara:strand:+ start:1384 stop:1623 length:240 start_codon:yes stop_codon:yes gene_type:complete